MSKNNVKPVFLIQVPSPFYNTLEKTGDIAILQKKIDELKANGWIAFLWCTKEVEKTTFTAYGIDVDMTEANLEELIEMASNAVKLDEIEDAEDSESLNNAN